LNFWCRVFHFKYWRADAYHPRPNTNDFRIEIYCSKKGCNRRHDLNEERRFDKELIRIKESAAPM